MRSQRATPAIGRHGRIATRILDDGRVRATAQLKLWDERVEQLVAIGDTVDDAYVMLQLHIIARLRLSELDAWRDLTPDDPFCELTYCWLDCLWNLTNTPKSTCAEYQQIAEAQLNPAFADLTIGELTPERIESYLAHRQVASEASARVAREVLALLVQFAVKEGLITRSGERDR